MGWANNLHFLIFLNKFLSNFDVCSLFRKAFRDELALLQKIRHPNVVQFLGAVTQSSPMMIVTEYLPKVPSGFQLPRTRIFVF